MLSRALPIQGTLDYGDRSPLRIYHTGRECARCGEPCAKDSTYCIHCWNKIRSRRAWIKQHLVPMAEQWRAELAPLWDRLGDAPDCPCCGGPMILWKADGLPSWVCAERPDCPGALPIPRGV